MKKRIISICLAMAVVIAMLPQICLRAEATDVEEWEDFIATGAFWNHISDSEQYKGNTLEYAIYDLNADGVKELVLQGSWDPPFYFTFLFVMDNGKIVLANEDYGYGSYRYSPKQNMIIGVSETKSFNGTGYCPFYSLAGGEFRYEFTVGQDMGESFYYDGSNMTTISDEERSSYFEDAVWLDFTEVKEIAEAEMQESGYAKIVADVIEEIGDLGRAEGFGTLYDVDGNGVPELLMIHSAKVKVDSEYYGFGAVCSAYTMLDGEVVALLDHKLLYLEAGDPSAYIAVAEKDGETYLAVHRSNAAVEELYYSFGSWELYTVNGTSIKLEENVEYEKAEGDNGSIVDDKSFSKIEDKFCEYTAYLEWASGIEELFAIYPTADSVRPQPINAKTLEELLEYLKAYPVEVSEDAYGDYLKDLWLRQHMEYADSAEYDIEITGGYSEWMMDAFRDARDDSGVVSYEMRKHINDVLGLDLDFSEADMYELVLAELLFGNSGLGITEKAYAEKIRTGASNITDALVDIVNNSKDIPGDVVNSIKDLYEMLNTLTYGSETYSQTFSKFCSLVGDNVDDIPQGLKADANFLVYGVLIDGLFEQYEALEDVVIYLNNYIAYKSFSEDTRKVLQSMVVQVYWKYDNTAGPDRMANFLGNRVAMRNLRDLKTALESVIGAMMDYEEHGAFAVAEYAVDRATEAGNKWCTSAFKDVAVFGTEKLLSCIPVVNAILVAKNVISVGVGASVILDEIFTNVEERKYAVEVLIKAYVMSFMLDVTVESTSGLMMTDGFSGSTVFDESISIYKKNQLLASDYVMKYAQLAMADMLEKICELEFAKGTASAEMEKMYQYRIDELVERLNWYSQHMKDLQDERAAIEAIACHDYDLWYDRGSEDVHLEFERSRLYIIACPVDVVVCNEAGEQIAYLSGESNEVPDEYRHYFHTIKIKGKAEEYIKAAIVPEGWKVELLGTAEGTMNAFIMDYGVDDTEVVECYFNIPVKEGSAGYFDNKGENGTCLVMNRKTYQDMDTVEDILRSSDARSLTGIWIACAAAACGIILIIIFTKRKKR